ncbi:MAG TPA: hypothetical protein VM008_16690 [Phycisphaerae bacterium]|nr:hypothetical protein [Phycisphaerae bacterium]
MQKLILVQQQSETPFFMDAIWCEDDPGSPKGIIPKNPSPMMTGNTTIDTGDISTPGGRIFINRHDKAINVSYVDGSARVLKLIDIWQPAWYNGCQRATLDTVDVTRLSR